MKRLRDTEASSPLLQKAHALLDAAPPLPDSRERMLRIRRALEQPRPRGGLMRVPAFAVASAVVLFGASAFAAVRIFDVFEAPAAAPPAASPGDAKAHRAKRAHKRVTAAPLPQAPASPAIEAAEPAAAIEPAAQLRTVSGAARVRSQPARGGSEHAHRAAVGHAQGAARHAAQAEHAQPQPEIAAEPEQSASVAQPQESERAAGSDSELVHRAVRALRRDGDPALAARLLQEHRARSPHGPLAEEALSLQIEAAVALRSPRAAALAREYLARYPGGRYASVAEHALQEAPP